jgi:hypothetical protein
MSRDWQSQDSNNPNGGSRESGEPLIPEIVEPGEDPFSQESFGAGHGYSSGTPSNRGFFGSRELGGGRVRVYGCSPGCLITSLLVSIVLSLVLTLLLNAIF